MPSSSRRKQSKPQHLTNDKNEDGEDFTNKPATSTELTPGDQSTQEVHNQLKNIAEINRDNFEFTNGFGSPEYEDGEENGSLIVDEVGHQDTEELEESLPEDLSSKVKVDYNDFGLTGTKRCESGMLSGQADIAELKGLAVVTYNVSSKESCVQCPVCDVTLSSKEVLQNHLFVSHNIQHGEVSIAQQTGNNRKRPLDENGKSFNCTSPLSRDSGSEHSDVNSSRETEMASKRVRGNSVSPHSKYGSAIPPHLTLAKETNYDTQMSAYEAALKGSVNDMVDPHICQVCSKMFPKPSDLKRHMMCHTGEKPFRCQFCNKPFRAKSSMQYHLKATHGMDIELSPGLEERYLRMKTRAQMNLLQRGHLTGLAQIYGSESGNYSRENVDFDDVEDDAKSSDSFYHNTGNRLDLTSETTSQGITGQTGNDSKTALDLSVTGTNKSLGREIGSTSNGEVIVYGELPHKRSKLSVQKETVLVTRVDGLDLMLGGNSSVFKCYLCSEVLSSLSKMQSHLSIHYQKQNISYQCCFCDKIFREKLQMQEHMRGAHSSDIMGLNQTKDSITTLLNGEESDSDGSFSCSFCFKHFDSMISLHKHTRLHTWNRNYCCKICGKSFSQYTSLQVHVSRLHWKTVGKSKIGASWVRNKLNFINVWKLKPRVHQTCNRSVREEPLNLMHKSKNQTKSPLPNQNVMIVLPQSPLATDDNVSDTAETGLSQHSSENNWSESLSENPQYDADDGDPEIRTAPKRSLMPLKLDTSPRGRLSRKSTPLHTAYQNHATSDNELPLNFSKSDHKPEDTNNNESSNDVPNGLSPELHLPITASNPEAILPGYGLNSTNHLLMAKALAAHQSLTHHLNNTSQPMIFPPNHLPPSLAAMNQMMSLPVSTPLITDQHAGTSKSPSPASHSSSKSDTSPEDRDSKDGIRESILGYPRVQWGQEKAGPLWSFNMYRDPDTSHTDGRKVSSLSRTHSRLGIVQSPINREAMCKPTTLTDGRTVYKCPFCSKEFVSFSDINRHMDFHEDIRPYKCHYCDYYARTNSQLKVHMMRHQGIREFCCKLCNYKGVTQSDLNRHMKSQIHMLKSRNACSYCGEGFVTTKNLEKHLDGNCIVKMQKLHGGLDLPLQERVA